MLDDGSEFIVVGMKLIGPALEIRDLWIGQALSSYSALTDRTTKVVTL